MNRRARSSRKFQSLLLLLVVLTLGACRPEPKAGPFQGPEEGWIPDARGPRWVTYVVEGGEAVYQGDVVFPLAELREWQATVTDPIPLRVESYDMIDGSHWVMYDTDYGDGTQGAPHAVLMGGTGLLTDGQSPTPVETGFVLSQPGAVAWAADPTITFHFDGVKTIDTVRLDLRSLPGHPFADRVEIRVGDQVVGQPLGLDVGTVAEIVDVSGAQLPDGSYEGLGLEGSSLELTLFRTGSMQVIVAEVAFESGTRPAPDPLEPVAYASIDKGASWGSVVPYSIASGFTSWQIDEIEEAIAEWQAKTDYTFEENRGADKRIRFKPHGSRCYATGIGRPGRFESLFGSDVREVRLADTCFYARNADGDLVQHHGMILHEIGHALGFYHEQSRTDRAQHIHYYESNVKSSGRSQYEKQGDLFGNYNFNSIMHYRDTQLGRKLCCSDPDQSGAVDTGQGLPEGCFYQHVSGIDTNGDDKPDSCDGLESAPHQIELKTMVSRRDLPEDFELGQRWEVSKGDAAAANKLLHGIDPTNTALSIVASEDWGRDAGYTLLGDVNNDGRDDLVAVYEETTAEGLAGSAHVSLGQPDGTFRPDGMCSSSFCHGEICRLGDLDGDGRKDLVSFDPESGFVRVAYSYGGRFTSRSGLPGIVNNWIARGRNEFVLADVDGNCTDDILTIIEEWDARTYRVTQRVLPATVVDGEALAHGMITIDSAQQLRVADVNGDSRADLVHWNDIDGTMSVRLANDPYHGGYGGFAAQELFALNGCSGSCELADMNGDGRADVVDMDTDRKHHLDRVKIRQSTGFIDYGLSNVPQYHELDCRWPHGCDLADVNGDGHPDLVDRNSSQSEEVWVSVSTGLWSDDIGEVNPRSGGNITSQWSCLDIPVLGY